MVEIWQDKDEPNEATITFWESGHRNGLSYWQKLRWIWHIVWHGYPYRDMFCLNVDNILELREVLAKTFDKMIEHRTKKSDING